MTTIAYKDGVLASDGRVTENGSICTDKQRKIHRLRSGHLVGWCGSLVDSKHLMKWLRDGGKEPIPKMDLRALIIHPDGTVRFLEDHVIYEMKQAHYAIGSGADFALGAMDAGASAKDAVKIAVKRDSASGGRVQTLRITHD